jgi:hypothetical protein
MTKAKLDLGKFLSGGRAAQQAVDEAIAAHGRELSGAPKPAPEMFFCLWPECPSGFMHPLTYDDCGPGSKCAHLLAAGWRSALARFYDDRDEVKRAGRARERHRLTRWGWFCPTHAAQPRAEKGSSRT